MRWRPILLIGVPVALIAGTVGYGKLDRSRALDGLVPPGAIVWTVDNRPVQIRSTRRVSGEVERFDVEIQVEGEAPYHIAFEIDHDMYGGGFVGGLDPDEDGEIELVLATRLGPRVSRMVELEAGRVIERSFDEVSKDVWPRVKARLDKVSPSPYALLAMTVGTLWLMVGLTVYLLVGLRALFKRLAAPRT